MKATSTLLFILFSAFVLTSCGAQKTSATLEVSTSALSMSNTTFSGGVVIMGSSNLGSFTIPVPAGTGSGNQITLDLPRATWTFSAVGWEGATPFGGTSKCGSQTVDLKSDEQTVNLQIDYAKCVTQSDVFGSSTYRSGNAFIDLKIATCGWLYEANGITPVSSTTANTFCNSASSVDAKYKNWAKSVKLEVPTIIDGVTTAGISRCISTGTDGLFSESVALPSKGVPYIVSLYARSNCEDENTIISKFDFSNGFDATYSDFDSVLNENAGDMRIFLPSYDTRRGYSSLYFEKPNPLLCSGNPCFTPPASIPGGNSRIIRSGSEFVVTENPTPDQSCDKLNAITPTDITPAPALANIRSNCEMKKGQMIVRLSFTAFGPSPQIIFGFMGGGAPIPLTFANDPTYDAHQLGWETIGYQIFPTPTPDIRNSFRAFFDHSEDSGLMSQVRDLLGPEGAGGILGPGLTCATATAVNFVTFLDEGVKKTYKVELSNAESTPVVSAFQANATVLLNDPFEKKISISRKTSSGNFVPEMALHFNCTYSVGRFQSYQDEEGKIEKRLIEWNTENTTEARVKEIRFEEEKTGALVTKTFSSFRYAESPSLAARVFARTYELRIEYNGTDYSFYPKSSQVAVDNIVAGFSFVDTSAAFNTGAIGSTVYETNLAAAIAAPTTAICSSRTSFAVISAGMCSGLPLVFNANPVNETWVPANLRPANIAGFFSPL